MNRLKIGFLSITVLAPIVVLHFYNSTELVTVVVRSSNSGLHGQTVQISYFNNTKDEFLNGQKIFNMSKSDKYSNCLPLINSYSESPPIKWTMYPRPCDHGVSIVWLIKSSVYRSSLRRTLRRTWAQEFNTSFGSMKRIFLIGSSNDVKSLPLVNFEGDIHKDILQGSFKDTFRGVTMKVLMGLQFVKNYCKNVKKVIISDDDAMVLPWNLFPLLNLNPSEHQHDIDYGGFIANSAVVRNKDNRWYVSEEEYNCTTYPTYPFGTVFALSLKAVKTFYDLSRVLKPFVWDDVYFGILAEIGRVNKTQLAGTYFHECNSIRMDAHAIESIPKIVACHGPDLASEHLKLWHELCYSPVFPQMEQLLLNYCRERVAETK